MAYVQVRLAVLVALCCWAVALAGQTAAPCDPETPSASALQVDDEATSSDRYASMADRHLLFGRASYYSDFFDGRETANGEVFRQVRFTAAHRTLPLGCWIEVKAIATGRKVRVKVNDRGPFAGGFVLDLSRVAARSLGVDRAGDRRVEIKVVALPGEDPPPVSQDQKTGQVVTVAEIVP